MTTRFRAVCMTCRKVIIDHAKATIHVPTADVQAAERATRDWEQRHPGQMHTLGELFELPEDVAWRVDCDTCNPHRDQDGAMCGGCYWFTANRCHTWAELVHWTAHLAGKGWIDKTNWFEFIRAIADGTSDVGLIADPAERYVGT